jgi:hypothetical protein
MSKADHSDTTRRRFLTSAAGGAVAATIPADARAYPGHAADPIYAAIEKHRAACIVWDAAVSVRAEFPEGPAPMTDEASRMPRLLSNKAVQS